MSKPDREIAHDLRLAAARLLDEVRAAKSAGLTVRFRDDWMTFSAQAIEAGTAIEIERKL